MFLISTFVFLISMLRFSSSDELQELQEKYFKDKKCAAKCIFRGDLNSKTIDSFPSNCSRVCSFLKINEKTDVPEERLNRAFKNVTSLLGQLEITNTNYTSGNFLSPLEEIDINYLNMHSNNEMREVEFLNLRYLKCYMVNIFSSNKMERITMRKLVNVTWDTEEEIKIFIFSPNQDFCIDTGAAKVFTKTRKPSSIDIYARFFCEPARFDDRMCRIPRLGCVEIFGNWEIGPGYHIEAMKYVEVIYGSLIIKNSNLTGFDGFESLQYIISLNPLNPVLLVEGNSELVDIKFPKMKKIKSTAMEAIIFDGNNQELSSNSSACFMLQDVLSANPETSVIFDGHNCAELEEILSDPPTTTIIATTTTTASSTTEMSVITSMSVISTTTQKSNNNGSTKISILMGVFMLLYLFGV